MLAQSGSEIMDGMKTGRGRRVALVTVAVGVVVVIAAGFAARARVLEEYWLRELDTTSPWDRLDAVDALDSLSRHGSARSIPPLLDFMNRAMGDLEQVEGRLGVKDRTAENADDYERMLLLEVQINVARKSLGAICGRSGVACVPALATALRNPDRTSLAVIQAIREGNPAVVDRLRALDPGACARFDMEAARLTAEEAASWRELEDFLGERSSDGE